MEDLIGMLFYMFLIFGTFGLLFVILAIVLYLITGGSTKENTIIALISLYIGKLFK